LNGGGAAAAVPQRRPKWENYPLFPIITKLRSHAPTVTVPGTVSSVRIGCVDVMWVWLTTIDW